MPAAPWIGIPAQLTSFIGREREIEAVRGHLAATRLLTLAGAGGSGKTRLAIEVAARAAEGGTPGVWVELAAVRSADLVPGAVLSAMGASDDSEGVAPSDRLAEVIGGRALVLVLDNCEHLVDACASLADHLLRRCPALRVLATSREPLGVTGETAWLVPPLSLPAAGSPGIETAEAVQLFIERAHAVQPGFALTRENADAVAQICRRLDGLPLALELAAARLRVLAPDQIAARLDDRFRLLTTGNRTALPRHQTLRAAIDWSYDLLDARARTLLARLAVFRGGFTLEAAEEVCRSADLHPGAVLDTVAELVEKSLVDMRDAGESARYRLLETVRQYGIERSTELGELADMRRRHAGFFVAFVATAEPHLVTTERPRWIRMLQAEVDNVRQALAWTAEHDDAQHVRLVGMLHWFWFATGDWPEARRWLRSALTAPAGQRPTRERAAVQFSAGAIASLQARSDSALAHLVPAAELAEALGDERLLAYIRNYHAMALTQVSSPDAEPPARLAERWFREAGDLYGLRLSLLLQCIYHYSRGAIPASVTAGEDAVRVARAFGLDRELAIALQTLGQVVMRTGDVPRAMALHRESLQCIARDVQPLFLARALEMVAWCIVRIGRAVDAARIYGAAAGIRETIGARMWQLDAQAHDPATAAARVAIGDAAFDAEHAAGRSMPRDDAIAFAIEAADLPMPASDVEPTMDTARQGPERAAAPASLPALRVQTLGAVDVWVDGAPVPRKAWGFAKVRELLVLLLLHPEGRTREQVGAALWPDASSAQVRNNFHVTLHTLRKALGDPSWIRFDRDRYRIDAARGIELDAARFEQQITAVLRESRRGAVPLDAMQEALALYHGAFLDGITAGDWHLELRDRLALRHAEALELFGTTLLEAQRHAEAVEAAERLIDGDPCHEGAYRILMRARAAAGDAAGVAREFRRLERVLMRELGSAPSRESAALLRTLSSPRRSQ